MVIFSSWRRGGPFFWGFGLLAAAAAIYALAVAVMAARMRLAVSSGAISYLEYFKPRSVPADRAAAFQLMQSRGRYGPGPMEGRVLGRDGQPLLHGMAVGAFEPLDMIRLAASIHKPITGDPRVVVGWIRPSLRRSLGTPDPEQSFAGGLGAVMEDLRSRRSSGQLRVNCVRRTISVDFVAGRPLAAPGVERAVAACFEGDGQFTSFALSLQTIDTIEQTLMDASYYVGPPSSG